MKRLLFLLPLLSGCGEDPGAIEVVWSFPADRVDGCAGAPEVATVRANVFEASVAKGQEIECRDGQTILIPDVAPGSYSLVVDALAPDDTRIYAQTVTGVQIDAGKTHRQTVTLEPLAGTLHVTWTTPVDCATDGVRDVRFEVWDREGLVAGSEEALVPCADGETLIEGSWILTQEFPDKRFFLWGQDVGGVETHEFARCELAVESGVDNELAATLAPCGGACDPDTRRAVLCPPE